MSKDKLIEEIATNVSNRVYTAVVGLYEEAEHAGLIVGNGHHMAQEIAQRAKDLLMERYWKAQGKPAE